MRNLGILGGALALLAATPAAAAIQAITVDVSSYKFQPSTITMVAGSRTELILVNRAGKSHDFSAPTFFARSQIVDGAAPRGRIELKPGERRTITLIPQRGVYKVHCSHFGHDALGMKGEIDVVQ